MSKRAVINSHKMQQKWKRTNQASTKLQDSETILIERVLQLEREIKALRSRNAKLQESLFDMVQQHCSMDDGALNSSALSANADAMHLLAEQGLIELTGGFGRVVTGKAKLEAKP